MAFPLPIRKTPVRDTRNREAVFAQSIAYQERQSPRHRSSARRRHRDAKRDALSAFAPAPADLSVLRIG